MRGKVFIQILNGTAANAAPIYCASETPFSIVYNNGVSYPSDAMFHTIDDLRDGLRDKYGVPDSLIPNRAYFEATDVEREIGDDPIYRVVAF